MELGAATGQRMSPFAIQRQGPSSVIAKTMDSVNETMQHRAETEAEEALNRTRALQAEIQTKASTQIGGNAQGVAERSLADFDEKTAEISDGMSNQAKALYKKRLGLVRTTMQGALGEHETKEGIRHTVDVAKDVADIEAKQAAANYKNPDELALSRARMAKAADTLSKTLGWDETQTKAYLQKTSNDFHVSVIAGALDAENTGYARDYLGKHEKEMDPAAVAKVKEALEQEDRFQKVTTSVDRVYAEGGTFAEKSQKLRDIFKDDEKGQKSAIQELHERKRQEDVAHDETIGVLWDMKTGLNGQKPMGIRDIMKTKAWASLDGEERQKLSRAFESDDKRNAGEGGGAENIAKFATYLKALDNPEALMKTSDAEIIGKYTGVIGTDLTKKLLIQKREIGNDFNKVRTARIDGTQFKDLAREYGLKVDGTLKDEDRAVLGSLRDKVLDTIAIEQKRAGKELDQDQKEKIVRGLLKKVPTRKDGWLWDSTEDKPLFQVESFMDLDATDAEKTRALEYLVNAEAPTTPENVWTMIQAMRKKGAQ